MPIKEGEYFIRKRIGKHEHPWGVYQRLGGQDIRITAFKTEMHARYYAAAQTISEPG
jgi:hypothetical protein